jgi:hypothetical protein
MYDQSTDTGNSPQVNNSLEVKNEDLVESYQIEEPKTKKQSLDNNKNLTPLSIMVVDTIGAVCSQRVLKVLFDPGATKTFIHRGCLPKHCLPVAIETAQPMCTIAGNSVSKEMVVL